MAKKGLVVGRIHLAAGLEQRHENVDIIVGITAIVASIALFVLFMYNALYAVIAVVLFGIAHQIYRLWLRRHTAKRQAAAAAWHKDV